LKSYTPVLTSCIWVLIWIYFKMSFFLHDLSYFSLCYVNFLKLLVSILVYFRFPLLWSIFVFMNFYFKWLSSHKIYSRSEHSIEVWLMLTIVELVLISVDEFFFAQLLVSFPHSAASHSCVSGQVCLLLSIHVLNFLSHCNGLFLIGKGRSLSASFVPHFLWGVAEVGWCILSWEAWTQMSLLLINAQASSEITKHSHWFFLLEPSQNPSWNWASVIC